MTIEEAIINLNMISVAFVEPVTKEQRKLIDDTFEMAIQALSQEPCEWGRMTFDAATGISKFEFSDGTIKRVKQAELEPCEDAVSREAVLDAIRRISLGQTDAVKVSMMTEDYVKKLPPAPQKSGKWIEHPEIETSTPEYLMFYECSECGNKQCFCKSDIHKKRFCSNCGAKMESEDKE